jgi:hypothetical protein
MGHAIDLETWHGYRGDMGKKGTTYYDCWDPQDGMGTVDGMWEGGGREGGREGRRKEEERGEFSADKRQGDNEWKGREPPNFLLQQGRRTRGVKEGGEGDREVGRVGERFRR